MKPDRDICVRKIKIPSEGRNIPALVLSPKKKTDKTPGILWIHGGGYIAGMKEMVHMSRAVDLVKKHGAVVFSLATEWLSRLRIRRHWMTAMMHFCI